MQAFQNPLVINESIYFDYTPPPTFAGHYNRYPFKINITSSNDKQHVIALNAKYSKSYNPQPYNNKWSFLRPEYRFLDLSGNKIDHIITQDTPFYSDNNGNINNISGTFIGVSGFAEFYFIDDLYNFDLAINNQPYTTIIATLQTSAVDYLFGSNEFITPTYSNSLATAYQPHIFYYRKPDQIRISENGIRDFINPRWSKITQPVIFSINWKGTYNFYDIQAVPYIENSICKFFPLSANQQLQINANTVGISSNFNKNLIIDYVNNDGYLSPGYCKTTFDTPNTTNLNCSITATVNFDSGINFTGNNFSPKIWISNPDAGTMVIAEFNNPNVFPITDFNFQTAQFKNINVPIILKPDLDKDNFATIGYHGINSVAVLPPPDFKAWACDGELNYLYKFSTKGNIISAIDINQMVTDQNLGYFVENQVSPASITLDSNLNIWMTLYDTVSVLKLDPNGNFLFALNPLSSINYTIPPNINNSWYLGNEMYPLNGEVQNFIEPTYIETDQYNNVWVTYSNYASGYLMKYDTSGNLLKAISYPAQSCPQDVIVDKANNVWIALSNNTSNTIGSLEKRNSNGMLLSSYGNINGLNNLTLDLNQNIWFTYSYSRIATIDNLTGNIITINTSDYNVTSNNIYPDKGLTIPDEYTSETALEGIASDVKGNIFVINSVENQVYVFDSSTKNFLNKFYINPKGFNFYNENGETVIEYNSQAKSAQAYGDWTGFRWINKYYQQQNSRIISLTGKSVDLDFYTEYAVDVFKTNENFDMAGQMKSLAFMPVLQDSPFLFDNFLGSILGKYPFNHNDLSISSYEKIANFVPNITDVDTCGIDQLYNLANSVNFDIENFALNYPEEIKRLINLASINKSILWGTTSKKQNYFIEPSSDGIFNRGQLLTFSYMISAGSPVILHTRSLNSYNIIPTGPINGLTSYPLSTLASYIGLETNWQTYYNFYQFIPGYSKTQTEGVIDWNNPQTTITQTQSSLFEWIGDQQMLDKLFSYKLYNGLGLLKVD